ncbi:hypothetical protein WVI01_00630 [Weissella viridescens]|uniref:Uncharacterized protein n=2 Tax=Weissella viridescens TaxID=1629 RepID=A0A0R2H1J8_WEIVI|nr:hypothetical protein [Weissella viridescens]KRN46801.1 hypothetical protein IV50_GL000063 [Weissella viridescens]GEA94140.1 hypothetical protein WVI01_00630 [Weissella viridescens]
METLISTLITTGGLGFANVLFLERTGVLHFDNQLNNDKYMWLVVFSALNFAVQTFFNNIYITVGVSIICTGIVYGCNYKLENLIRNKSGLSSATDENAADAFWNSMFAKKDLYVFVFDLNSHQLLDFGEPIYVTRSLDKNNGIAMNLNGSEMEEYANYNYESVLALAEYNQSSQNKASGANSYSDYENNKKYIAIWND